MIKEIYEFIASKDKALNYCESNAGKAIVYRQSGHDIKGVLIGTHENRFIPRLLVRSKTGKEYSIFIENLISIYEKINP